jgi:CheY-like chemotaxis protein
MGRGDGMSKKRILLVDDSKTVLMMEQMILSKSAYEIVTASDGQQAIEKATDQHPDLILMDVLMPHMGGFEACARLRSVESTRGIPIIMVTTRGEAESIEKGYVSGCSDYITKPINGMELLTKLKNYLGE